MYLLGIDLGTSGLKAAIFDLDGQLLGRGFARSRYLPAPPGWAEQDPGDWWKSCCRAVAAALSSSGATGPDIAAVGICGFHHCPVFLAADGEPTRPTIVTHDSRLGPSLEDLRERGLLAKVEAISHSRVTTGHFPPIYNLVRTRDPDALDGTRWILLAKDYLRFKLTGTIATELCDATGTNLVAMPEQTWSKSLCDLIQVPEEKLPELGHASAIAGQVTKKAAEATGLSAGTPVAYGGGDSHCALVGLGLVGSGEGGVLLGTNSTLRASFDTLVPPLDYSVWIQQHVVPGRFTVSASSMAGSSVLDWFASAAPGLSPEGSISYGEIDAMAAHIPAGSDGLLFHPYLYGERSPFYNPEARGAFLGIKHWHGREHLVRSVLEGVAFSIANCLDAIQSIAQTQGQTVTTLRTGQSGGSRLPTWLQIITDVVELPLQVIAVDEPGCLGAAVLAGAAIGAYSGVRAGIEQTVRVGSQTSPDGRNRDLYRERRSAFNDTYHALESRLYVTSG